jgi:hypothetical protein
MVGDMLFFDFLEAKIKEKMKLKFYLNNVL